MENKLLKFKSFFDFIERFFFLHIYRRKKNVYHHLSYLFVKLLRKSQQWWNRMRLLTSLRQNLLPSTLHRLVILSFHIQKRKCCATRSRNFYLQRKWREHDFGLFVSLFFSYISECCRSLRIQSIGFIFLLDFCWVSAWFPYNVWFFMPLLFFF